MRTVHKTCNLCEATCGVLIDVERDKVLAIRPDENDPFSRGHICPKAFALKEIHEDPDRLKKPLRRKGKDWEEISWEEALEEAASRLAEIQKKHGDNAVATYMGNPSVHNFGTLFYSQFLLRALGTRNRFSASSVDQNPKHASSLFLFGHILSVPIPDLDRTQYLLVLGANPVASNGSLMTAPDVRARLKDIQKRGGKVVVIDPRRTETAQMASEHHFIRPGEDAFFLAALLHTVIEEKLGREGPAASRMTGLEDLRKLVRPFSPEAVEARTGIAAAEIRRIAREFAKASCAACYGRIGTCLQEFGTLSSWLVDVLNLLTGNVDRPGGAMFTTPAVDLRTLANRTGNTGHYDVWRSRVRNIPEFNGEIPVACLAEEILTPGEGQIRGLLTIAGNPVLSAPNGVQMDKAFSRLGYYVAVDIYLNETTRHAHLILPPRWSLEQDNYEVAFHGFAIRNTAKYSPIVVEAGPGTKADYEILSDLTLRVLEKKAANPLRRAALGAARRLKALPSPRTLLDFLLRTGPRGDGYLPWKKGLSLKRLEENPSGVDLGALEPSLDQVLVAKSGKIELGHPLMGEQLGKLAGRLSKKLEKKNGELLLIGRRELRSNNSWGHNSPTLAKGSNRCNLIMNPYDADRLNLKKGEDVNIRSRVGEVVTRLSVSDEIMQGVVSLPHGWGHNREGIRQGVAGKNPGVSANDLTDEMPLEQVVGNAVLNGVPVTVSGVEA